MAPPLLSIPLLSESDLETRRGELLQLLADDDVCHDGAPSSEIDHIVTWFAKDDMNRDLRPFQVVGSAYLLDNTVDPHHKALVMIRPPGDGKSLCYIVAGLMSLEVTLVIQPTLTLSADQASKLNLLPQDLRSAVFNIDMYKTHEHMDLIVQKLISLKDVPPACLPRYFIIASPKSISDKNKPWLKLFQELAKAEVIRLIVTDELHLIRDQGVAFRDEFLHTGERLISQIRKDSPHTPLVAFTATATIDDIAFVEKICRFKTTRIVWATPLEMQKREVNISMTVRTVFRSVAEKLIVPFIKSQSRFIVYVDFETHVDGVAALLRQLARESKVEDFNVLEISGSLCPEMKAFFINVFCENLVGAEYSQYRALVGTTGASATVIDPNVDAVFRNGCPPSRSTALQELGRLCRNGHPDTKYLYHVTLNVQSYFAHLCRTEKNEKACTSEKQRAHMEQLETMKMFVWRKECIHAALERRFGRPGSEDVMPPSCGSQCPYCSKQRAELEAPFFVEPLQQALASIFLTNSKVEFGKNSFVKRVRDETLGKNVWAAKPRRAPLKNIDTHLVEFLVLQLIAAGLIFWKAETRVEKGESKVVVFFLAAVNDSRTGYTFSDISSFSDFPGAIK